MNTKGRSSNWRWVRIASNWVHKFPIILESRWAWRRFWNHLQLESKIQYSWKWFSAPTTIDSSMSDRIVLSMHGWRTQNHPLIAFFLQTIPTFFWFPQPAKSNLRRPLLNYCVISFPNIQVEKSRVSLTCSFFGRLLEPQEVSLFFFGGVGRTELITKLIIHGSGK